MAASNPVSLKPPENFDFSMLDLWSKWKKRFEQFASACGHDKEDDARRISTLLYCLGEEVKRRAQLHEHIDGGLKEVRHRHRKVRRIFPGA